MEILRRRWSRSGKRCLAALAIGAVISCCAIARPDSGAYFSLAVWNAVTRHGIEDVKAVDPTTGHAAAAAFSWVALPKGAPGWSRGGTTFMPFNDAQVPERLSVSWRLPPAVSAAPYSGPVRGPFPIELRSQIPDSAHAKAVGSYRYEWSIGLRAGVPPVTLRWTLIDTQTHAERIAFGGDWRPASDAG